MDLIRRFPPQALAAALASWVWLPGLDGTRPIVASAFGDVFLQGRDGVWFLDTVDGTLTRQWEDTAALQDALNTPDGQGRFLLAGLVEDAHEAGIVPGEGEVLSFSQPPVLGGNVEVGNVEVCDLVVALSVAGQVHEQVKDLPPGAPVLGISVDTGPAR